jgi:hypothetical protein
MESGGSGTTIGRAIEWFLHHDKALSHTSPVVQQFLSTPKHPILYESLSKKFLTVTLETFSKVRHIMELWIDSKSNATA